MENAQMENMNGCFRSSTIREKRHLIFTSWSCSDGKEMSRKHLVLLIQLSWSSFSLFLKSEFFNSELGWSPFQLSQLFLSRVNGLPRFVRKCIKRWLAQRSSGLASDPYPRKHCFPYSGGSLTQRLIAMVGSISQNSCIFVRQ